ncbi:MAG: class A beta-lactamase-related serine hydrolase [Caldilinea sp. CFX5]|nr:class A beta-lactamase-related serine hydrolase [Caldilinea sp. CFX5]
MKPTLVAPEEVGFSATRLARIRPAMQKYVDQGQIAGISTLIARRGKVFYRDQVGLMDKATNTPMREDAIFRIYSMTKPIICTALMTLYEEGKFHLFDPVAKYIPAFGAVQVLESDTSGGQKTVDPVRPMTVRDLFMHTAGLTYDFLADSPVGELYREARLGNNTERTLEEMILDLARLPLAYQPGSRWHYSLSIDVLAYLIEVLSGQPLRDFLKSRFFAPLGMTDTDFGVPANKQDRLVTMYGLPDLMSVGMTLPKLAEAWLSGYNEQIDVSTTYPADRPEHFARGGHGLFSTVDDYLRFTQMLLNGGTLDGERILGRKIVELMHTNHLPPLLLPYDIGGIPWAGYGFGLGSRVLLNLADSAVPGSVGEFGWSGAAKTYYWIDPQEQLIGILMSQYMMGFEVPEKDLQLLTYQALVD